MISDSETHDEYLIFTDKVISISRFYEKIDTNNYVPF